MNTQQFEQLQQASKLLVQANQLVQAALGSSEQCYAIHTQIEDAADSIDDVVRDADEQGITA